MFYKILILNELSQNNIPFNYKTHNDLLPD